MKKRLTAAMLALCMLVCTLGAALGEMESPFGSVPGNNALNMNVFTIWDSTRSVAQALEDSGNTYTISRLSRTASTQTLNLLLFSFADGTSYHMQIILHKNDNNIEFISDPLCGYTDEAAALMVCSQINIGGPVICCVDEDTHSLRLQGQITYLRTEDAGAIFMRVIRDYLINMLERFFELSDTYLDSGLKMGS